MFDFLFKEKIPTPTKHIYTPISDFSKIFTYLYNKLGISDLEKRPIVQDRLSIIAQKYKLEKSEIFLEKLQKDTIFHQEIVDAVTVNETFFLRETENLEWLVEYIAKREEVTKILSIPSSSGEEIYSILLLLHSKDPKLLSKVEITGIDINQNAINKAIEATYSQRSLHYVTQDMKMNYFIKEENLYKVSSILKKQTTFKQKNIFELSAQEIGTFNIILSRNLFIYFDKVSRTKATNKLIELLAPNAILLLGHADILEDTHTKLSKIKNSIYLNQV